MPENSRPVILHKLSIKSEHSKRQNQEKIKKFYPTYLYRVKNISVRKNTLFFASNVNIEVMIERPLFGRGPKRGKNEYRNTREVLSSNEKFKTRIDGKQGEKKGKRAYEIS